jgi:hypothetical protein
VISGDLVRRLMLLGTPLLFAVQSAIEELFSDNWRTG